MGKSFSEKQWRPAVGSLFTELVDLAHCPGRPKQTVAATQASKQEGTGRWVAVHVPERRRKSNCEYRRTSSGSMTSAQQMSRTESRLPKTTFQLMIMSRMMTVGPQQPRSDPRSTSKVLGTPNGCAD